MAVTNSIPANKRASCTGCGRDVWKTRTSAAAQRCRDCRKSSQPHGTSAKYFQGCRCDECRDAARVYNQGIRAKRVASGRPMRLTVEATCKGCGVAFSARRDAVKAGRGAYCSPECHNASQVTSGRRERDREFLRVNGPAGSVRRRALKRSRDAAKGTDGGNLIWVQGACIVCAAQFMSPGAASRYCSKGCRDKNRANKSYGLTWLDRMALFARDDWNCQICSEPMDYTADPQSDWYPTIDHILPRSKGGGDELSNLRSAHMWCNAVRGDLSFYTDADLAA